MVAALAEAPGPRGFWPVGQVVQFRRDPLALEDHEAGGYLIPRGSLVLVSQYVMHRDPRFWPDPERFTPEAKAARPQFAYFPFGGGPRRCVGEGFAWMEAVLILAALARRWRLRLAPGTQVRTEPRITLRPARGGLPMKAEAREP
jgi:cytochrome P450